MTDESTQTAGRLFLLDQWEEGYVEERAWVEVLPDDSPEKAITFLANEVPLAEDEGAYFCNNVQVWMEERRTIAVDGRAYVPDEPEKPCETCGGGGYTWLQPLTCDCEGGQDPQHLGLHKRCHGTGLLSRGEQCGDCHGTKLEGRLCNDEGAPWKVIEEQTPDAKRFWLIEVGLAEDVV